MPPKAVRAQLKGKTKSDTNAASATPSKGSKKKSTTKGKKVAEEVTTLQSTEDGDVAELDAKALARIEEELQRLSGATTTGLMETDPTKLLDAPVTFSQEDLDEIRRYEESLTSWRVQRADQQPANLEDDDVSSDDGSGEEELNAHTTGSSLARPESAHRRLLQQHATKTTATTRPSSAGRLGPGNSSSAAATAGGHVPQVQALPMNNGLGAASTDSGTVSARASALPGATSGFGFGQLVKMVLPPEMAHQDSTAVADALIEVTSARLDDVGMESTECLECLTNVAHLHLQRNRIQSLSGIEFMLNLNVLLLRGNQIESINDGALTLLPIKVLDLGENNLDGPLDTLVVPFLPFESLTSLCLEDNPCTVRKSKAKDTNHPATLVYRNVVLSKTPFLVTLDGVEVSQEEKVINAMDDPYDDEDGEGQEGVEGEDDTEAGIIARHQDPQLHPRTIKDSDFTLAGEDDDDDIRQTAKVAASADVLTMEDGVEEGEDESGVFRPPSASTASKPATPLLVTPTTSGAPKSQSAIAGGVMSKTQQMQAALLKRYMVQVQKKTDATQAAVDYQGEDDGPAKERKVLDDDDAAARAANLFSVGGNRTNRAEDNQEMLQQVCGDQQTLRDELRQLGTHHSRVVTSQIAELYNNATASLDERRDKAGERRRQNLYDTSDVPSAAYARALELLKSEAGSSDLDKFRKTKEDKKKEEEGVPVPTEAKSDL